MQKLTIGIYGKTLSICTDFDQFHTGKNRRVHSWDQARRNVSILSNLRYRHAVEVSRRCGLDHHLRLPFGAWHHQITGLGQERPWRSARDLPFSSSAFGIRNGLRLLAMMGNIQVKSNSVQNMSNIFSSANPPPTPTSALEPQSHHESACLFWICRRFNTLGVSRHRRISILGVSLQPVHL